MKNKIEFFLWLIFHHNTQVLKMAAEIESISH